MTAQKPRFRHPKQLDAGIFQAEISSFALRLAAEGKAAKTIRTYTEAVQWFAAARPPGRASWEQVNRQDIQQWMTWLLDRYSNAYASNQYRALQQFFKWLAAEEQLPDPMAGLHPPTVTDKLVPVFTGEELTRLEQACAGRSFAQRRDTAIIAVFTATGIRLAELAARDTTPATRSAATSTCGGGRSPSAARAARTASSRSATTPPAAWTGTSAPGSRHAQAQTAAPRLGAGSREPLTAAGIYQMTARRGRQAGVDVSPAPVPAPLQPHLAGPRRARGGPDGTQRLDLPADAPPLRRQRPQRPRPPHLRPDHDRHLTTPARPRQHGP